MTPKFGSWKGQHPLSGMETAEVGACGGSLGVNFGPATFEMFIEQTEVSSRPWAVWVWSSADQVWSRYKFEAQQVDGI